VTLVPHPIQITPREVVPMQSFLIPVNNGQLMKTVRFSTKGSFNSCW
jgi:hypothetical protein